MVASTFTFTFTSVLAFAGINAITDAVAAVGVIVGTAVGVGVGVGAIAVASAFVDKAVIVLFTSPLALGILIRGLIIRLYATMRHPLTGLSQLPQNWRETLLVIDCAHPPELLPQASTINPALSVKGAWGNQRDAKGAIRISILILIPTWYLPALAYRWSLKASAWLWFPLALALTPPLHSQKAQDSRRNMAILHAWH